MMFSSAVAFILILVSLPAQAIQIPLYVGPDLQQGCYSLGGARFSFFLISTKAINPNAMPADKQQISSQISIISSQMGYSPFSCYYTEKADGRFKTTTLAPEATLLVGWAGSNLAVGWQMLTLCSNVTPILTDYCSYHGQNNWKKEEPGTVLTRTYISQSTNHYTFRIRIKIPSDPDLIEQNKVLYSFGF